MADMGFFVILIGTLFGGSQKINMIIFNIGYFLGFVLILGNNLSKNPLNKSIITNVKL